MATRVLLLVMTTTLFAAAWTNDYSRHSLNQPVRSARLDGKGDAPLPVATAAARESAAVADDVVTVSACPAPRPPAAGTVTVAVAAPARITPQEIAISLAEAAAVDFAQLCGGRGTPAETPAAVVAAPVAELHHEADLDHGDLSFIEREELARAELASMEQTRTELVATPAETTSAPVATVHEQDAGIFADCDLQLPARMAAGEYRIVTGRGEVLYRTFSSQELAWLGSECDPAAAACQELAVAGVAWYFIRVNVPREPASPAPQIADEPAGQLPVTELPPEARAALRMAVSHLDRRVDWLGSRLTEAARGPGRLVRLMESLLLPGARTTPPVETSGEAGTRNDVAARSMAR